MAGHTPGPWRVHYDGEVDRVNMASKEYRWPFAILGPDGEYVARFDDDLVSDDDAELMAAAPDLLAACEMLIAYVSNPHGRHAFTLAEAREACRAAIAKARSGG